MQTSRAPAPFSLVDQWQTHLKINGRAPRTLEELAIANADYEHRRRLAEIKAMHTKLALLDPFLSALAAHGINLAHRDLSAYDSGKAVRIFPAICTTDDKLYEALIALGFREIERKDWGRGEDQVRMKHGRSLIVVIDVTKPEVRAQQERAAAAKQAQAITGGRWVDHIDGNPLNNDPANLRVVDSVTPTPVILDLPLTT